MNKVIRTLMLAFFLVSVTLTACGAKLSCSLQAVAGGAQYCEEQGGK